MFTFKSYDNANGIGAGNFNAEHLLKAINNDGKALMTSEDAKFAMLFLDPTGKGRFSYKQLIELFSHDNILYLKDYSVNLCLLLHAIFEANESQLMFAKTQVADAIIKEHSQVIPATSLKDRLLEKSQFTSLMGATIGPQPE
jgi:hypothetical protein